jgi:hypothetical protein
VSCGEDGPTANPVLHCGVIISGISSAIVSRLSCMITYELSCVCQVAKRTAADKKGGHLARRKSDGRLLLRESAMVSDGDKGSFEDISKCAFLHQTL